MDTTHPEPEVAGGVHSGVLSDHGVLSTNDLTNIIKMEFDFHPGATAASLTLREPMHRRPQRIAISAMGRNERGQDVLRVGNAQSVCWTIRAESTAACSASVVCSTRTT